MRLLTSTYGKEEAGKLMGSIMDAGWGWDSEVPRPRPDMSVMQEPM